MWLKDVTLFSLRRPRKFGQGPERRQAHISENFVSLAPFGTVQTPVLDGSTRMRAAVTVQEWPSG
jgi:hypothetical protein